jgi:hypothetical protein
MLSYMRTIVDLPDSSIARLAQLSAQEHVSRAELVRRAIDRYLAEQGTTEATDVFGIWADRHLNALAYEDELRGSREPPSPSGRGRRTP